MQKLNDIIDLALKMFPDSAAIAMRKVRDFNSAGGATAFMSDCFRTVESSHFDVVKMLIHPRGAGIRRVIKQCHGYSENHIASRFNATIGTLWGVEIHIDESIDCAICLIGEDSLGFRRNFKF
jgi:hypothetical protein